MGYFQIISSMNKLDADAQAFLTASGITDQSFVQSINNLVRDLKSNNLWTKFNAIYPFVGTTAAMQRFNLKNTAQYTITFQGGATYTANGYTPTGTGYANTGLNGSSVLSQNSHHIAVYSRTNSQSDSAAEIGAAVGSGASAVIIGLRLRTTTTPAANRYQIFANNTTNTTPTNAVANSDSRGFFFQQRTASNYAEVYRNGTLLGSTTGASNGTVNLNVLIGAMNLSPSPVNYTTRNIAFASFGQTMTSAEALTYYNIVQSFQTSLNRNV
jgi:hypothetical protein